MDEGELLSAILLIKRRSRINYVTVRLRSGRILSFKTYGFLIATNANCTPIISITNIKQIPVWLKLTTSTDVINLSMQIKQ